MIALLLALNVQAETTRYSFDNTRGSLTFDMVASLHDVHGEAGSFSGELFIGEDRPTGKVTVQAAQLTTDLAVRDDRMHDFCLDVERYPTVDFRIGAVTGDVKGLNSRRGTGVIELRGQLTVRSSTRDVVLPVSYTWEGDAVRLVGSIEILWTDYGVPDPSIFISTLYPEMDVRFNVLLTEAP